MVVMTRYMKDDDSEATYILVIVSVAMASGVLLSTRCHVIAFL